MSRTSLRTRRSPRDLRGVFRKEPSGLAKQIVDKIVALDEYMDPMGILEYGGVASQAAALCRRMAAVIPEGTTNAAIAFALSAMLATADEDWAAEVDG